MTRKTLVTLGMVVALLVSMFGTVAAQSGDTPPTVPSEDTSETTPKFYTHPVVQILSAYFGRNLEEVTDPGTPTEPEDPSITDPTLPEPKDPQELLAEEIAGYHEDGIGFGVLVKLYAMAEASQEACPTNATVPTGSDTGTEEVACTAVTVADLLTEMQTGKGMGQLFKDYGKPALLGVGQVKKALKEAQDQDTSLQSDNLKGKKPDKANKKGKGNH